MTAVLQAATLSTLSNVIAQIIEARRPQVIPEVN